LPIEDKRRDNGYKNVVEEKRKSQAIRKRSKSREDSSKR
jgi:hypothetical protein